ncbi:MAG TPA: adenylate/guanylate cyclase domain-containing protein [Solirubrobacteraceae bacterium]|nr:adenylate/guanylate cyclase domain-containing protein [Solirubrobacteraceae bacterium]
MRRNDLAAELTHRLDSDYQPSPERVEYAIGALVAEGLIESEARDGEVSYRTTASGVKALDERAETRIDTFLFTDVVGSTALLDRLGDHVAHVFRRRHFALLRGAIGEHAGTEVKSLGDGLMVVFADARAAVACAVAMQRAVAVCGDPMILRIGIDMGEAVREQDDFFGRPVIVARRLCDVAQGGQVVVSETVRRLAGAPSTHVLEPLGALVLKGLNDPVSATALRPAAAPSTVRGSLSNEQQWRAHTKQSAAGMIGVAVA